MRSQLKFLESCLSNINSNNKCYIEFDDDIQYAITNNVKNGINVYESFNVISQNTNGVDKNCERMIKHNNLIKSIGGSKCIKTKYSGTNKLFKLLRINNEAIIFLIKQHDKNLRLEIKLSTSDMRRMHTNNNTSYRNLMCEISPCIMYLIPTRKELKLYNYYKNDRGDANFIPWPYGNVFDSGNVCIGSVEAGKLLDYKNYISFDNETNSRVIDIDLMIQMCYFSFFNTSFNTDLVRKNLETLNLNYQNRINNNSDNSTVDSKTAEKIMAAIAHH